MTLAEAFDVLFSAPLSDFVGVRDKLANSVKDDDEGLAKAIKKTRKPSVSAWAVNQLYHQHRGIFATLGELVNKIKDGHEGLLTAGELTATMSARTETIADLVEKARGILEEAKHSASSGTLEKVKRTLEAHALPGEDDEKVGWLTRDLEPKGFGALGGLSLQAPLPAPDTPAETAEPEPEPAEPDPVIEPPNKLSRARAAVKQATASCSQIENDARGVTTELEKVRARTVELEQKAQALLQDLEKARAKLAEAKAALAEAEDS